MLENFFPYREKGKKTMSSIAGQIKSGRRGLAYIVSHLTSSYGLKTGLSRSRVVLKRDGLKGVRENSASLIKQLAEWFSEEHLFLEGESDGSQC